MGKSLPFLSPQESGMGVSQLLTIEQQIGKALDKKKLAGAVTMVIRKGGVVHLEAHGWQDVENHIPMQTDTIFRIYSMTKPIVSTAVMMLAESGEIDIDAPLAKYLPSLDDLKVYQKEGNRSPKRPPTVRDLLRHTAGMTYGFFGNTAVDQQYRKAAVLDRDQSSEAFLKKVAQLPLVYDPGEDWIYSIAVDVQGILIEQVSGQSLDTFLKQRIFDPLAMKDTGFHVPKGKAHRLASYYGSSLKLKESGKESRYLKPPKFFSGGGGLVSTAMDYAHFVQMLLNGGSLFGQRLLKPETVAAMTRNHLPTDRFPAGIGGSREGVGFGLGVSIQMYSTPKQPGAKEGEFGWNGIASTHFWASPSDDLAVITMEQTHPFNKRLIHRLKGPIYDALRP